MEKQRPRSGRTKLGKKIRKLREEIGLSQARLSANAKVSQGYLSQLESGEVENPSIKALLRLAFALSANPDEISEA